jgi:hypothetical protein
VIRYFLITLALLWLALGFLGFLVLGRAPMFGERDSNVLMFPAILLWNIGVRRILVDSAHGPPFLNLPGLLLVYFLPGSSVLWWVGRWRPWKK